jgi:ubiquinone/menaquinone biosynthesis C-methylase UbiE
MPLDRILEPEVMDSPEEATDYDTMDHSEVNRRFVDDLLAAIKGSGFRVQGSEAEDETPAAAAISHSAHLTPHLPEPRTLNSEPSCLDILDLGTGTALIPIELCRRYADCRVMAADAAVSMLELARYNVEVNSLSERIELAHVDAKRLPFADAMFDVVMSNSIVHHIPEPMDVLREAVRVTRARGLLFIRDLLRPDSDNGLQHLVDTYAAGANDHQKHMFADSLHAALSLADIRSLIVSLGLPAETVQQTTDRHWTWIAQRNRLT